MRRLQATIEKLVNSVPRAQPAVQIRLKRSFTPLVFLAAAMAALPGSSSALAAISPAGSAAEREFIVGFERGVSRGEQVALVDRRGAEVEDKLLGRAMVVSASPAEAARLSREGEVRYVEPNGAVKALSPLLPTDPQLDDLWGIKRIDAPAGWAKMKETNEVVVAVSDTGIWAEHEDLKTRLWTNTDEVPGDGVDNDRNGVVDDMHGADLSGGGQSGETDDVHGHGTHVAGTIGAEAYNNLGIVGVAPYVRLMNARFLDDNGSGQVSDGVRSIDYAADNGAQVINCSWGTTEFSQAIYDAIARARAKGVLIVAAAGNNKTDADQNPMYPAAYNSTNVISVAATTGSSALASFSNWGANSVDLGAPGLFIRSAIINGGSAYNHGTSMAAPHVSGVAAVLWGERPELGYWDIRRATLEGGSPLDALSGKTVTGKLANLSGSIDYLNSLTTEEPPAEPPSGAPPEPTPEPPSNPNPGRTPVLTGAPRISGSPNAPSTLTCDGGSWSGSNEVQVRWMRGGEVIGYGHSYATGDGDIGTHIWCRGIAYNNFGNSNSDSVPVWVTGTRYTPVQPPFRFNKPSIRKENRKTFRCDPGDWIGAERFRYAWILHGKKISNTQDLRIKKKWRGTRIKCQVTAYGNGGTSRTSASKSRKIPRK